MSVELGHFALVLSTSATKPSIASKARQFDGSNDDWTSLESQNMTAPS